eukprot:1550470-Pyramimonas_sp.AAC.2
MRENLIYIPGGLYPNYFKALYPKSLFAPHLRRVVPQRHPGGLRQRGEDRRVAHPRVGQLERRLRQLAHVLAAAEPARRR